MTETTLTFLEELFGSGLEAVQYGFCKHLTRYAQKGNTTVVVTAGTATFLVQRHKSLTLPILRDLLSYPDCVKDGLEPADGCLSSKTKHL